jgi:cell division protein FtsQ
MSSDDVGARDLSSPPRPVLRIDEARRRRLRPWAIAGVVCVALVTGSVALSYTSILGARTVEVEGEDHLAARRVMRLAGIEEGTNVFHLDTVAAERRLEAERWILDATVDTELPGTITIAIRERRPVLVLVMGDDRSLVAADGTVLGRAGATVALPEIVAVGDAPDTGEIAGAGEVVRAMAPSLRARVRSISVTGDEVSLVVDRGVQVSYGEVVDVTAKAQALRAILDHAEEQERALLSVDLSSPSAPTARFVGSQPNVVGPDPSADVETVAKGRDRGKDERGGRSGGEREKREDEKKSSTSP